MKKNLVNVLASLLVTACGGGNPAYIRGEKQLDGDGDGKACETLR